MTYRTVLVPVEAGEAREGGVRAALSVAGLFDAILMGVGASALDDFLEPALGSMKPPVLRALRDEIQGNLHRAEAQFRQATEHAPNPTLWRTAVARPLAAVARLAAGADLIVTSRPGEADPKACPDPGALIMAAGLPVLLAPAGRERLEARTVVVGWKDTREARRAVSDALPFMKRADRVVVACGAEPGGLAAAGLEDLVGRLGRHGVAASVEPTGSDRVHPADMLTGLAEREGADLIVVGGYGHSRIQDWVFGGVTEALLRRAPVFVLFSR